MPEPDVGVLGGRGLHRDGLKGWPDLRSLSGKKMTTPPPPPPVEKQQQARPVAVAAAPDQTLEFSDELLLRVLACLPEPHLTGAASLVCRRWMRLAGRLRRRLVVRDWAFVTHRLHHRFPELADLDLFPASIVAPAVPSPTSPLLTCAEVSLTLDTSADPPLGACRFLSDDVLDRGLVAVAASFPNLRRLSATAASESGGLMDIAGGCATLQELELHRCTDLALRPVSAFAHLQILRLVAASSALYGTSEDGGVTDIGLTILAHGCKRLVKLELVGCEGSYDGIAAVGRCCAMLEELTIANHKMDNGWLAALAFCGNLKTLRLQGCCRIDDDPGPAEHLGACLTLESLQLQQCQLRDRRALHALFLVCEGARELLVQNCWGLEDDMFAMAGLCSVRRYNACKLQCMDPSMFGVSMPLLLLWKWRVKFLSLEGCSQLTTRGLESVITSWSDLQSLKVVSCDKIKDEEISPALSELFSTFKELKWRPDNKSRLAASLAGTGMGKKGRVLCKRQILPGHQRVKGTMLNYSTDDILLLECSCGASNFSADSVKRSGDEGKSRQRTDAEIKGEGTATGRGQEAGEKMAAAAADLPLPIPIPCVAEPTAASRVSPGSSPARSDASEGAAFYAADTEAEPEASVGRSTQMLLAMAAMGGRGGPYGRRPASSYGSCAAWSAGSLTDHRPASPSPICSPVSSNGGEGYCDGGERRDVERTNPVPPRFIHKATPARSMRRARSSHNYRRRLGAMDAINEWRLPKVSEEEDEAVDQTDWQADTLSSRTSSARDWNFEAGGAYEGSDHNGGAFNHSDGENSPVAVQRMGRWPQGSAVKHKGNFVHAKLVAWKNAEIEKLIDKLRRKEADIDEWQMNQVTQAKEKMKRIEIKLEKKRARAAEKMQKAIKDAQKKADKKKIKEHAATDNQIASVERAMVKMSRTGKLPWSLAFL
uniref:Remorin C-terminal domain-containing protein n=1 Tax=Oryza meridionalis TaxID=40149 RepID=A0A0E0CPB9_9ORYZ